MSKERLALESFCQVGPLKSVGQREFSLTKLPCVVQITMHTFFKNQLFLAKAHNYVLKFAKKNEFGMFLAVLNFLRGSLSAFIEN